jgi:hypothetical protein
MVLGLFTDRMRRHDRRSPGIVNSASTIGWPCPNARRKAAASGAVAIAVSATGQMIGGCVSGKVLISATSPSAAASVA